MSDPEAAEAARYLNRARWGNQVAVRSAHITLDRIDELPAELVAQLHERSAPAGEEEHHD